MKLNSTKTYRKDIDGLRAVAVIAVIIFHFGSLPNGYLGVDIFFVISGYLITGIIYREINDNRFSIVNFYLRRTRRIIPLSLFIILVSLSIGIVVMLPDDMENLAQSVMATNFFSNNILQAITTKNYWNVANEFKPLIHTWSLGVEEQYYLLYPLLFLLVGKRHRRLLLPILIILTIISLILYFLSFKEHEKFYFIPFRFFELSLGGIAVIYLNHKLIVHRFSAIFVFGLVVILCIDLSFIPRQWLLLITVMLTLGVLVSSNDVSKISSFVLENKILVSIGLISFSLYMWHQVLLSYARYFVVQKLKTVDLLYISVLTILFSVTTYYVVERPFRDKERIKPSILLSILISLFLVTNISALYIYNNGGVVRDVPELDLKKGQAERGVHAKYNARILEYDKAFSSDSNNLKVLVIGNSFARDWVNVLLESKHKDGIDISYIYDPINHSDFYSRVKGADIIFYSTAKKTVVNKLGIDESKLFVIGTKNFGVNAGYFYNYSGKEYFKQRTLMEDGYLESNNKMKQEWGASYIDYISMIIDKDNTVPIFTPTKMFISQDCRHFTKSGASYFAQLFENELALILDGAIDRKRNRHQSHALGQ